ncbi:pumilio domain member 6 [Tulasnella sp. 403]|nr:pumilio domain member 6 [Tulasnella sp. 403]
MAQKRPAARQSGGPNKRPHLESKPPNRLQNRTQGKSHSKPKAPNLNTPKFPKGGKKTKFVDKDDEDSSLKRKRPITAKGPLPKNDSDTEDDGTDPGFEEVPRESDSDDQDSDEEDGANDDMNIDGPSKVQGTKAPGENHAAQRQANKERRLEKPNGALILEAKMHWEEARQLNITKEERRTHIDNLMAVVKGRVKELVTKHDSSRIIQTLVKFGSQEIRDQVALELRGAYLDLIRSKYSKHLVVKLLRYCPSQRSAILSEFHGRVISLLLHREATGSISDAFELYASSSERNLLIRDFYGREVALFDTDTVKSGGLAAVLRNADEQRRNRLLGALKASLIKIFENPDKGGAAHSIVHRALWEYLQEINKLESEEERTRLRTDIFENCSELLADMAHTSNGSRAVREFIAHGSAKDRKKIIKTFKPHVEKMAMDVQAQFVLFTLLDATDDTKLTASQIVNELVSLASKLCLPPSQPSQAQQDDQPNPTVGRRSILYTLVPRSTRWYPPDILNVITEMDDILSKTSKKPAELRHKEIRQAASPALLRFVAENVDALIRDPAGSLLVGEIMLHAEGDNSKATEALLKPLSTTPYPSPIIDTPHPIDLPTSSRLYKSLIQGGHFNHNTKTIDRVPTYSGIAFVRAFVKAVGKEKLVTMAAGGGSFVVLEIVERCLQDGTGDEKDMLNEWLGSAVPLIQEKGPKGKDLLLAKLSELQTAVKS